MSKIKNKYLKNFYDILMLPAVRILPGNIAFFLVLSIIPIITIIAMICSKLSISPNFDTILDVILPEGVEQMMHSLFTEVDMGKFSLGFVLLGFFLASNGADSIIIASNTLYEVKSRPYIPRRIKALFLTIILLSLIVFVIFILGFGNIILNLLLGLEIFKTIPPIFNGLMLFKWPIAIVVIFYLIKVIYTIAPDHQIQSKYVNKGAIFSTVGFIISTAIYSYYVNHIANYNYMYGNLSNIIVLMILMYVISYILVVGIAINANLYEMNKREEKE